MAKRKTKRAVAWVVVRDGEVVVGAVSSRESGQRIASAEQGWTGKQHRVVRLREVTPAEEAVLRAARRFVASGYWGGTTVEAQGLYDAVMRMEKGA